MSEDWGVFFNAEEHGTAAVLDGAPIVGLLDQSTYYEPHALVAGARTTFLLPSAQTTATTTDSVLVIGAATFRVRSIEPDGTGLTTLDLERQ